MLSVVGPIYASNSKADFSSQTSVEPALRSYSDPSSLLILRSILVASGEWRSIPERLPFPKMSYLAKFG